MINNRFPHSMVRVWPTRTELTRLTQITEMRKNKSKNSRHSFLDANSRQPVTSTGHVFLISGQSKWWAASSIRDYSSEDSEPARANWNESALILKLKNPTETRKAAINSIHSGKNLTVSSGRWYKWYKIYATFFQGNPSILCIPAGGLHKQQHWDLDRMRDSLEVDPWEKPRGVQCDCAVLGCINASCLVQIQQCFLLF